jgi:flagellar hook-length control protein FliK
MDNLNIAMTEPSRSGNSAISKTSKADSSGKNGINTGEVTAKKQSFSESMNKVAKQLKSDQEAAVAKKDGNELPVSDASTVKTADGDRSLSLTKTEIIENADVVINTADNLLSATTTQLIQADTAIQLETKSQPGNLLPDDINTTTSSLSSSLISSSEQSQSLLNDIGVQLEMTQLTGQLSAGAGQQTAATNEMPLASILKKGSLDTASLSKTNASILSSAMQVNQQATISDLKQADISINGQTIQSSAPLAAMLAQQTTTESAVPSNSLLQPSATVAVNQQTELSQLKLDEMALLTQKNQLSAQLSGLSGQQSTNLIDDKLPQLLQAAGIAADSSSATQSTSLNSVTNNITPMSFNPVTQAVSQAIAPIEISEPFGRPAWSQSMGKQILLMVNQNINSAEIRLNPANLGPVEVRIDMNDDQINIALSSRSLAVREAMEMALPKLREMFENNGMNLAGTDISQHSFAEQREQNTARGNSVFNSNVMHNDLPVASNEVIQQVQLSNSMVDFYI